MPELPMHKLPSDNDSRRSSGLLPLLKYTLGMALCLNLIACGGSSLGEPNTGGTGGQAPDPVVVDFPLAYVIRPIPRDEDGVIQSDALLEPAEFRPGSALYLQDRATATAGRRNLTERLFEQEDALYDVKHLSAHPSGERFLFALRAPEIEDADEDEQPTWNIWEYEVASDSMRRLMDSDLRAESGQDLHPIYLPDDRILFSSTRQSRSRAILLDDGKPQFTAQVENDDQDAFLLHVMDADGTNIEQISYNQSHDLQPRLLSDGRVLFSRWDGFNQDRVSLYTVNPDGTGLAPHYGYHSLNEDSPANLFQPRLMADGRLLSIFKPLEEGLGGDLMAVAIAEFTEQDQAFAASEQAEGQISLAPNPVTLGEELSLNGRYQSAYPLQDGTGRILISWSQCRLRLVDEDRLVPCTEEFLAADTEAGPPLFGVWMLDPEGDSQQPVVVAREEEMVTEPLALEPRERAEFRAPVIPDTDLESANLGVLHIRSLHDLDGQDVTAQGIRALADPAQTTAAERPARFLRLLKAVSVPDDDVLDEQDDEVFGNRFNNNRGLIETLGYVPVEPDGSVMTRVPADLAFSFELVDAQGRRLGPRHDNWLQLRAGEVRNCQGCHEADSRVPHGRAQAEPEPAYSGATTSGEPFPNTRRTDRFGSPEFPQMGETMAQFDARIALVCSDPSDPDSCEERGVRQPTMNMHFTDVWTDPTVREPDPDLSFNYAALTDDRYRERQDPEDPMSALIQSEARAPATEACQQAWTGQCRGVINYENHIQQIWERQRLLTEETPEGERVPVLDDEGQPIEHTCTGCHRNRDADNQPRVPAGQLELVAMLDNNGRMTSYGELLNNDNEQILEDGALVDRLVETGEFERDAEGELILDEEGEPIPILTPVTVPPSMSRAGARNSQAFFARFTEPPPDEPEAVDHQQMLNREELRLLSEWLDSGASYYNDPFDRAIQDNQ